MHSDLDKGTCTPRKKKINLQFFTKWICTAGWRILILLCWAENLRSQGLHSIGGRVETPSVALLCSRKNKWQKQKHHPFPKNTASEYSPPPQLTSLSSPAPVAAAQVPELLLSCQLCPGSKQTDIFCASLSWQLQRRGVGAGRRVFSPDTPRGEHQQAWKKGLKKSGEATEQARRCPCIDILSFLSACSYLFQGLFFQMWEEIPSSAQTGELKKRKHKAQYNLVCLQPFWNKEEKSLLRKHLSQPQ